MRRRDRRIVRTGAAAAFLLLTVAGAAVAQYIEPARSYSPTEVRFLNAGAFVRDFRPRSSNTQPDSLAISYRRVMPLVGFRQGPLDVVFGYTTYDLHGASCSAIYLDATFAGEYILAGNREQALILPFVVDADYQKSESSGTLQDNFNVGSIGIGTGIKYRMTGESVDFSAMAVGIIHYSFDGYSVQTGSSPAAVAEAVAILPGVGILNGLAVGYRFRYQSWTLGNGRYDYKTVNNGVFVGVLF